MVKIKKPLEVANGVQARNLKELKENFDLEKIVGYYYDGKLLTWLTERYYEEEAEKVKELLNNNTTEVEKNLCEIFGVEYVEKIVISEEELAYRNEKIAKLKQYTDDEEIIEKIDSVAFNQEELAELYDEGKELIYLCAGEFKIPKSKQDLVYVELGGAVVENKKKIKESYSFVVRERWLFDPKVEKSYENENGDIYNVHICSIALKNDITNEEEILTSDDENVISYITFGDKIVYAVENYEQCQIYMFTTKKKKVAVYNNLQKSVYFIYMDDEKVVWADKIENDEFWLYVKYYDQDANRLYCCHDYMDSCMYYMDTCMFRNIPKNVCAVIKDYLFFVDRGTIHRINMKTKEAEIAMKKVELSRLINGKIYVISASNKESEERFYKMNPNSLESEYITTFEKKRDLHIHCFDIYNNKLVWIEHVWKNRDNTYLLMEMNMESRKKVELDTWYGASGSFEHPELLLENGWIFYRSFNPYGKIIRKIRYDGTEKMDIKELPEAKTDNRNQLGVMTGIRTESSY